ncbi:CHAD domain-containing protein [Antribacter gilvus]|uniref:CHAD domain-containing protein n=1 Tax=Antribacter gilvus TaxID=2304675 RepID=UPI0013DE9A64|nr:CHAD domain-containing protein [Antribacter gilvus]
MLSLAVGELVRRIDDGVPAAIADEPEAVHRLRTSVRRLRNVLAAFRRYLDRDATAGLRAELKVWGDALGRARDLEVRAAQLAEAADAVGLDEEDRSALVDELHAAHERAHAQAVRWTRSRRGRELRKALAAWADAPPLADRAGRPAKKAARRAVRRQADRTLEAAGRLDGPEAAHALRKAARRLRHTCDAVRSAGLLGGRTKALGRAGHRIQSLLGDHRDALLLAEHVRSQADGSPAADAVVGWCQERSLAALADLPAALADLHARREALH